ncbi:MAG: biotin--[acetyl-CoA-carboxylase] ligase [Hyphomicrobiaceae bacterium]
MIELNDGDIDKRKLASPGGTPVAHVTETASTNADAMVHVEVGEGGPLWIHADVQTDGRGRSGRSWQGGKGNLHASFFATFECSMSTASQISLVAGVALMDAVHRCVREHAPNVEPTFLPDLRLKWPNDLYYKTQKLGGILVESTALTTDDRERAIVIGFGLNLAEAPNIADRPTTSLADLGVSVTPSEMLDHLDVALMKALRTWAQGHDFDRICSQWTAVSGPIGESLSVHLGPEICIRGQSCGLDATGALLLRDEKGTLHTITFGDVELDPQAY